jgi:hypothetical protein
VLRLRRTRWVWPTAAPAAAARPDFGTRQAFPELCIIPKFAGRARSSVGEHPLHTRGVVGSIPTVPTMTCPWRSSSVGL